MTPDFIPHTRFHHASWYNEPGQCDWYWYAPRKSWKLNRDESFYASLDSELKDIVKMIHSKGMLTTPSCAGHVRDKSYYSDIWKSLKQQESRIQKNGIQLVNPETQHSIQYKDPTYHVPWSEKHFVKIGSKHGKIGCLGIHPGKHANMLPKRVPGFITKQDGPFTIYLTKSDTADEIAEKWNQFKHLIS
jgi:hypothetical protein